MLRFLHLCCAIKYLVCELELMEWNVVLRKASYSLQLKFEHFLE